MLAIFAGLLHFTLAFNPIASLAGSVVAAMLWSRRGGALRSLLGWAGLLAAWGLGDGARIVSATLGTAPHSADTYGWMLFSLWGAGTFAVGYLLPAWAGSFVGRRVTFGTGWLSAAVVAATVASALGQIAAGTS